VRCTVTNILAMHVPMNVKKWMGVAWAEFVCTRTGTRVLS
jgi:hypothetical protein